MVCPYGKYGIFTVLNVQVVPHVTDEIKQWIQSVSSVPVDGQTCPADVCVIELGGTVGRFDII
jgi:CTP synthase (UTP-ammonia lyase)